MARDIEDILANKPEQTEKTAETPTEAATEAETARPRDEKGRFASKAPEANVGEGQEAPPPAEVETQPEPEPQPTPDPDSDPKNWTYAAYRDEKQKRQDALKRLQAAERRAQELETHFQQLQAQRQQQPPPDQFADPEGYNAYWEQRMREQEATFQERLRNHEANTSFRIAHDKHGETFEQAYQSMIELAESGDRSVVQAVANSPDPGAAMVHWYKTYQVQQEIGDDLPGYIERKVAERLAQAQPELTQRPTVPKGPMPSNLAGARSVGARTGPEWSGPQPITDIFDRRAKALGKR